MTGPTGKASISVAARGLTPAVIVLNAEGVANGTSIDFSAPVSDYLAGKGSLPSQRGLLNADELRTPRSRTPEGSNSRSWPTGTRSRTSTSSNRRPSSSMQGCLRHGHGRPEAAPMSVAGFRAPQEVKGYVIQFWDPSRPAFQIFRTQEQIDDYHAYRDATRPTVAGGTTSRAG